MQAELTEHLGYEPHDAAGDNSGNSRNGKSRKTLKGDFGNLPIDVPRDRDASFDPKIVPKGQTRFDGFDDKILSLYARGMTTREIQSHLEEMYQVEVSPALISSVTDAVIEEVKVWQNRPLDALYPILYLDALQVKIRDGAHIRNKAIYLAIAWRSNWERIVPFFAYPADIRRVIYTTNAIESVNMSLRKIIKNRGSFPTDESALKLLYLALQNIARKWTMPIKEWKAALNRFAILFEDRMPVL